nr:hypothetical protein [Tanacetum cinerariifolium]
HHYVLSGDRHQPTSQQSSHRSHGYHNDRHGSDRRCGSDNHHNSNNNYSGSNNRHQGECRRSAGTCFKCGQAGHLQKDCRKNTTTSTSGQADKKPAGHLQKDCKKNTTASTFGQADKKPGVRVVFSPSIKVMLLIPQVLSSPGIPLRATPTQYALLVDVDTKESVAANTSGTIMDTLFIYGHAIFVLFDTGATHSVISSTFA